LRGGEIAGRTSTCPNAAAAKIQRRFEMGMSVIVGFHAVMDGYRRPTLGVASLR
jgi:hypothetical protein